jgi:hypothetical protein
VPLCAALCRFVLLCAALCRFVPLPDSRNDDDYDDNNDNKTFILRLHHGRSAMICQHQTQTSASPSSTSGHDDDDDDDDELSSSPSTLLPRLLSGSIGPSGPSSQQFLAVTPLEVVKIRQQTTAIGINNFQFQFVVIDIPRGG